MGYLPGSEVGTCQAHSAFRGLKTQHWAHPSTAQSSILAPRLLLEWAPGVPSGTLPSVGPPPLALPQGRYQDGSEGQVPTETLPLIPCRCLGEVIPTPVLVTFSADG